MAQVDAPNGVQSVPVNVYETEGALVVVAPLPGVKVDDIEVAIGGGELRIRAEMRTDAPKDYLVHEWSYGPYERTVKVPEGFGSDGSASFGNGQLAVRLLRGVAAEGARTLPVTQHG